MRVIISLLVLLCTVKTISLGLDQKVLPIIEKNNLKSKFIIWESDIPKYILWNCNVLGNKSKDSLTTKLVYPALDSLQVTVLILDLNKDKTKDIIFDINGYNPITSSYQQINYGLEITDDLIFTDSLNIGDISNDDRIGIVDKYKIYNQEVSKDDKFNVSKVLIERNSEVSDTLTSVLNSKIDKKSITISIYPNPVHEYVSVRTDVAFPSMNFELKHYLIDLEGKVLSTFLSNVKNNNLVRFQLNDYSSGVYYIVSKLNGIVLEVNKIVKQ